MGWRTNVSESMPGGRLRDVHDARQRAALLAGDDVLTAQYKEMVDGGIVTEEVGRLYLRDPSPELRNGLRL